MGFLETAVVIYLRHIIYGDASFSFPIQPSNMGLAVTELLREAATIIMLIGIGIVAGKNALQRFAWFLFSFAIWDIFYYVFLKVMVDWPASLLTWDLLFLIPVPWVGPVITPCLAALSMMVLALAIIYLQHKGYEVKVKANEWLMLISGCVVLLLSFMWGYITFASTFEGNIELSSTGLLAAAYTYVPETFNWLIYSIGMLGIWAGIGKFIFRTVRSSAVEDELQWVNYQ